MQACAQETNQKPGLRAGSAIIHIGYFLTEFAIPCKPALGAGAFFLRKIVEGMGRLVTATLRNVHGRGVTWKDL